MFMGLTVKAILIVFKARRFTKEQKDVLNEIRTILGRDEQTTSSLRFPTRTKNKLSVKTSENQIHRERLKEIKKLIKGVQGVYITEQYEEKLKEDARREAEAVYRQRMDEFEDSLNRKLRMTEYMGTRKRTS
ncbi:5960_t:CDS:2 [Gigaspora margarita]|uniref:5960_t:CDS:1 n=1 Tax=Gigaspora margarita TaxID=4874 RepID=A0ABM8VYD7_GIGMA|nr:5960_t:CDS:2 [Gigaspora margarita]